MLQNYSNVSQRGYSLCGTGYQLCVSDWAALAQRNRNAYSCRVLSNHQRNLRNSIHIESTYQEYNAPFR